MSTEISNLTFEINALRQKKDNLLSAQKGTKQTVSIFEQEERRIVEEFQKKLDEVRQRKQGTLDLISNLQSQIGGIDHDIEALLKKQAELLKAQAEADFLAELEASLREILDSIPTWKQMYAFQREDVFAVFKAYREGKNGFAIFNDMGLGKTAVTIMSLAILIPEFEKEHGRKPRVVWLTGSSLILSSIREFQRWNPAQFLVPVFGKAPLMEREFSIDMAMQMGAPIITNYETMNSTPKLAMMDFDFVVIDECHKLKGGANNKPSQVWVNAKDLCRRSRFILMLSGTPMVNAVEEMWSYLHIFDPERFGNLKQFKRLFGVYDYGTGKIKMDADKLLTGALWGRCIRRKKSEVGIQMPAKIRAYRYLEMTDLQREHYEQMRKRFFVKFKQIVENEPTKMISAFAIIAQLTRLRQISVFPASMNFKDPDTGERYKFDCFESSKVNEAMNMIEEFDAEDENVVIFSTFNEPLVEIAKRCDAKGITWRAVHGEAPDYKVDPELEFQQNKIRVMLINSKKGQGMNLHKAPAEWEGGASNAILMDLWWTPAINEQCEDRIYRLGVTDNVTIHILHNENSIDSFIAAKVEEKAESFENILERKELRPAKEWMALLEGLV